MSKILVINNEKETSSLIAEIIKDMGYLPIIVNSTLKGFNVIKEEKPECIIIDIFLLNTGEIELLSLLKSNKNLKGIPIITTVPNEIEEDKIIETLKSGVDEYIKKPISPIELKTRINIMMKLKTNLDKIVIEREFVSTILDNTELFILVTDFNFNILKHNTYVSKFFYSSETILGKNFLDLAFSEEDYLKNIRETLKIFIESDSKTFHPEIILIKYNKAEHPFKWTITKEFDPENERVLIFVGHDMSETRRYEAMIESLLADSKLKNMQLEEANALLEIKNSELSELNALKTEYISIASHDLRSPISQIMGLAQLLLKNKRYTPTEPQKKLIERILESAEFQLSLVSDLLDITRVETGNMKLELELSDINSLIKKSVESVEELIKNKGIKLTIHEFDELRLVKIDSLKILQVINNLLGNAIKFTGEGGTIDIKVIIEEGTLTFSITDTGLGIKEEELPNIFEKFNKYRKQGTMGEKGTGLGLSICKKLIELHKGEIGVKSEYGKGSTFFFKINI